MEEDLTGEEIRRIRAKLELSRRAFADRLGVSIEAVKAWELGNRTCSGPAERLIQIMAVTAGVN